MRIQLKTVPQKFLELFMRMPIACVAIVITSILWILYVYDDDLLDPFDPLGKFNCGLMLFAYPACFLNIAFTLRKEDGAQKKLWMPIAGYSLCLFGAIWFVVRFPYYFELDACRLICFLLTPIILIFTLPFLRDPDDRRLIRFTGQALSTAFTSLLLTLGAFLLLALLLASCKFLFDTSIKDKTFVYLAVFLHALVFPLLTLAHLPSPGDLPDDSQVKEGKFHTISCILFLSILCLYMVVIAVYGLKILITWNLPRGLLSYLLTGALAVLLLLTFVLYHKRSQKDSPAILLVFKWLPIAMLVLLPLMSVGILRRFLDYGPSTNRLYLLLFHLWSYGVCILILRCNQKLNRTILLSFFGLFMLCSVTPINPRSFSGFYREHQLRSFITEHHLDPLPEGKDAIAKFFEAHQEESEALCKQIWLLRHDYNEWAKDYEQLSEICRITKDAKAIAAKEEADSKHAPAVAEPAPTKTQSDLSEIPPVYEGPQSFWPWDAQYGSARFVSQCLKRVPAPAGALQFELQTDEGSIPIPESALRTQLATNDRPLRFSAQHLMLIVGAFTYNQGELCLKQSLLLKREPKNPAP